MANGKTYGVSFPFLDSTQGKYLDLTQERRDEIRADLIHLLLTRKGSRYFLPDFGTRLYEYLFEPLDLPTFNDIEQEIRDSIQKYLPNLQITSITIKPGDQVDNTGDLSTNGSTIEKSFNVPGKGVAEYTAKVRIDYAITDDVFASKDFVIINI
jgi:phage baseplate assembly protein W